MYARYIPLTSKLPQLYIDPDIGCYVGDGQIDQLPEMKTCEPSAIIQAYNYKNKLKCCRL